MCAAVAVLLLGLQTAHAVTRERSLQQLFDAAASLTPPESERQALLAVYNATNGAAWSLLEPHNSKTAQPWDPSIPACSWSGVSCCILLQGNTTAHAGYYFVTSHTDKQAYDAPPWNVLPCTVPGSVASLNLENFQLSGMLPMPALLNLSHLQSLNLANNPGLHGGGASLVQLSLQLTVVNLHNTSLSCTSDVEALAGINAVTDSSALDSTPGAVDLAPVSIPSVCQPPTAHRQMSLAQISQNTSQPGVHLMTCALMSAGGFASTTVSGFGANNTITADPSFWLYQSCICPTSNSPSQAAGLFDTLPIGVLPSIYQQQSTGALWAVCQLEYSTQSNDGINQPALLGAVLGALLAAACAMTVLAACIWQHKQGRFAWRKPAPARDIPPGTRPDLFSTEVTLVATDVEGSTELWEWSPEVMNAALTLHDTFMRASIAVCGGYEVATEGDAFLVAWHTPVAAVRWCLMVQQGLLKLDWPQELLAHPLCYPRPPSPVHSETPQILFKGLNVRMGVATGVPTTVRPHPTTGRMQYRGLVLRLVTAVADMALGGQVLLEPCTFKPLHGVLDQVHVPAAEAERLAEHVNETVTTQKKDWAAGIAKKVSFARGSGNVPLGRSVRISPHNRVERESGGDKPAPAHLDGAARPASMELDGSGPLLLSKAQLAKLKQGAMTTMGADTLSSVANDATRRSPHHGLHGPAGDDTVRQSNKVTAKQSVAHSSLIALYTQTMTEYPEAMYSVQPAQQRRHRPPRREKSWHHSQASNASRTSQDSLEADMPRPSAPSLNSPMLSLEFGPGAGSPPHPDSMPTKLPPSGVQSAAAPASCSSSAMPAMLRQGSTSQRVAKITRFANDAGSEPGPASSAAEDLRASRIRPQRSQSSSEHSLETAQRAGTAWPQAASAGANAGASPSKSWLFNHLYAGKGSASSSTQHAGHLGADSSRLASERGQHTLLSSDGCELKPDPPDRFSSSHLLVSLNTGVVPAGYPSTSINGSPIRQFSTHSLDDQHHSHSLTLPQLPEASEAMVEPFRQAGHVIHMDPAARMTNEHLTLTSTHQHADMSLAGLVMTGALPNDERPSTQFGGMLTSFGMGPGPVCEGLTDGLQDLVSEQHGCPSTAAHSRLQPVRRPARLRMGSQSEQDLQARGVSPGPELGPRSMMAPPALPAARQAAAPPAPLPGGDGSDGSVPSTALTNMLRQQARKHRRSSLLALQNSLQYGGSFNDSNTSMQVANASNASTSHGADFASRAQSFSSIPAARAPPSETGGTADAIRRLVLESEAQLHHAALLDTGSTQHAYALDTGHTHRTGISVGARGPQESLLQGSGFSIARLGGSKTHDTVSGVMDTHQTNYLIAPELLETNALQAVAGFLGAGQPTAPASAVPLRSSSNAGAATSSIHAGWGCWPLASDPTAKHKSGWLSSWRQCAFPREKHDTKASNGYNEQFMEDKSQGGSRKGVRPSRAATTLDVQLDALATAGPEADGVQNVTVIDMGVHLMKSLGPGFADAIQGVQLMQVLPVSLAARAAYLLEVSSEQQLAPSFFDAPGAKQAMTMQVPGSPPQSLPAVTMMFISPEHIARVEEVAGQEVADQALAVFSEAVRKVLQDNQCYESQESQGVMMVVAAQPHYAVNAALELQLKLLGANWPAALLRLPMAQDVRDATTGGVLFRGLRAKVGIYQDVPLSIVPHTTTGRADYFGRFVNRAARFMAGAVGGQILIDSAAASSTLAAWAAAQRPAGNATQGSALQMPGGTVPVPSRLGKARASSLPPVVSENSPLFMRDVNTNSDDAVLNPTTSLNVVVSTPSAAGSKRPSSNKLSSSMDTCSSPRDPQTSVGVNSIAAALFNTGQASIAGLHAPVVPPTQDLQQSLQESEGLWPSMSIQSQNLSGSHPVVAPATDAPPGRAANSLTALRPPPAVLLTSYPLGPITDAMQVCMDSTPGPGQAAGTAATTHGAFRSSAHMPLARSNPHLAVPDSGAPGNDFEVQVLDLGEYMFKGVAQAQSVVGLQLTMLAGRPGGSNNKAGGKAVCVREGKGVIQTVIARLHV